MEEGEAKEQDGDKLKEEEKDAEGVEEHKKRQGEEEDEKV